MNTADTLLLVISLLDDDARARTNGLKSCVQIPVSIKASGDNVFTAIRGTDVYISRLLVDAVVAVLLIDERAKLLVVYNPRGLPINGGGSGHVLSVLDSIPSGVVATVAEFGDYTHDIRMIRADGTSDRLVDSCWRCSRKNVNRQRT